jgi:uncharacterized membrane protein HdeD (DUF308 family)
MAGIMLGQGFEEVREHWLWFLVLGIALIVLGCVAIGSAVAVTLLSVMVVGWVLIFGGLFQVAHALIRHRWNGFIVNLLAGVLYAAAGFLMVSRPGAAAATLTLMIAMFLIVAGSFRLLLAFTSNLQHRGWLVLNGVVGMLLGFSIWAQWPASGLFAIGLFIGIDLIFDGWSEVMLALGARTLPARGRLGGYGLAPH